MLIPSPAEAALPDTAAGRQLAWLIEVLNERGGVVEEAELIAHFTADFLQFVPIADLQTTFGMLASSAPFTLLQILPSDTEDVLITVFDAEGEQVVFSVEVDAVTGVIDGLGFDAVPDLETGRPTTWEEVDASIAGLAARTSYLVARVEGGQCQTLHEARSVDRLAFGSTFKLYVLAELARQIEAGTLAWTDSLVIRDALKSLPSGVLQDAPEGSQVPIVDVATGMISISDNTAADHLMDRLGRENIEANMSAVGHGAPELDMPLLSTREFFLFKLAISDAEIDTYLTSDLPTRRAFVNGLAGQTPELSAAASWVTPRRVGQIEWFGSAGDLCRVMAALDTLADRPGLDPLHGVLSTNPGVSLDAAAFPYVAFKGGSEPGVVNVTWLVHAADGTRYFVSIGMNDDADPLTDLVPPLRAALGIFDLLAAGE